MISLSLILLAPDLTKLHVLFYVPIIFGLHNQIKLTNFNSTNCNIIYKHTKNIVLKKIFNRFRKRICFLKHSEIYN